MTPADLIALHRTAIDAATAYIGRVRPDDLPRPTPCAEWDLRALLAHMVGQNRGFTVAVRGGNAPKIAYGPEPFTEQRWIASAGGLISAFAQAHPEAMILEVELNPTRPLPLTTVVGAHLVDTAVHTWDVARSLDLGFTPPSEVADAVLRVAESVPDSAAR
jgi:uncharacterized protein (TIGR03086 family)